jgi:Protein of unknown function (DUF1838)
MIGRRSLLAGLGAAALPWSGLAQEIAARSATAADLDAYLALRFGQRDQPIWFQYAGTIFALPLGRRSVRMFDVVGVSRSTLTRQTDGTYLATLDEAGWYCDPETGSPLKSLASPINGRTITVKHYRSPQKAILSPGRYAFAGDLPPGIEYEGRLEPLVTGARDVWISEDLLVRRPRKASAEALATNPAAAAQSQTSLATFRASRADFARRAARPVPATLAYQTLASWRDWFDADEVPGVMSWRTNGTKLFAPRDITGRVRDYVLAEHSELLEG